MIRLRILNLLLGDILLLGGNYLLVALILIEFRTLAFVDLEEFLLLEGGWLQILTLVASQVWVIYWLGLYDQIRVRSRRVLTEDLLLVFGTSFLIQAISSYSKLNLTTSRWIMIFGSATGFVVMICWRVLYTHMLVRFLGRQRVLLWGNGRLARELALHISEHPEKGYEVIGFVDEEQSEEPVPGVPRIHSEEEFYQQILGLRPDRICVYTQLQTNPKLELELLRCSTAGVRVESLSLLYEDLFQQVPLEMVTVNQLVFSATLRPRMWVVMCQEIYGRAIAIAGIFLTWPLMALTAIAVRLDSPGPALLKQRRVGRNGIVFEILKFRSMFVDADARFGRKRANDNDPRITRVGWFIRRTRLDELPQFFNVLAGDMALVGPRPEIPVYVEELAQKLPLYVQRHRVKPGITGWAQLHHVPENTIADTKRKVQYDLYYIKNMSLGMDLIIMFHTIRTILLRVGAR